MRNINTKTEFIETSEETGNRLSESEFQLADIIKEVYLIQNTSKMTVVRNKSTNIEKINNNVKIVSIPLIKESINSIFRKYASIKSDVNQLSSARSSFDLSDDEKGETRALKTRSDQFQVSANKVNNYLNDFEKWLDQIYEDTMKELERARIMAEIDEIAFGDDDESEDNIDDDVDIIEDDLADSEDETSDPDEVIEGDFEVRREDGVDFYYINGKYVGSSMTTIEPPSLLLDEGPADIAIDSVVDDLQGILVMC